jgi:hypothetical protein
MATGETEFGAGPGIINSEKLARFGDAANTAEEERDRVIATPPGPLGTVAARPLANSADVGLPSVYNGDVGWNHE